MTFFDYNKSFIENAALLSTPLLLIIGAIGLKQIQLAKKNLKITSIRDAAKFTIQITEDYSERFTLANDNFLNAVIKHNIKPYEGEIENFSLEKYNQLDENWRKQWEEKERLIIRELVNTTSLLEGYSIPFIKKIADENIAFNIDCYVIIQLTKQCYPYIVRKHNEDKLNLLACNAIELFLRWQQRIENLHNEKELIALNEKIKTKGKVKPIKPIGSE